MVWRSVGNSHTEFARESAIDELAIAAGRDPSTCGASCSPTVRGRCARSNSRPNARTGDRRCPKARARGIACSRLPRPQRPGHRRSRSTTAGASTSSGSCSRSTAARNVNPDLIRAQVEGGLLWGLSAAAWGEIVLGEGGDIVTQNFDRYPVDADAIGPADRGAPDRLRPSRRPASARSASRRSRRRWPTPSRRSPAPGSAELPFSKTIKIY